MRAFKTKSLARFTKREAINDASLMAVVDAVGRGVVDADLGGGIIKQRVARTGQGKRGGYRVLIAFRSADRAIFIYGFAKSARDNIEALELRTLRDVAAYWLAADDKKLLLAVQQGILIEVRT
jgi:hypothetical protein